MAKRDKVQPADLLPDESAPWNLPKAFQTGGKFDILTPLEEIDESATQLQAKAAAVTRGQLASVQGNVAALQQTARESIDSTLQSTLDDLSDLIVPPVSALSRGLGEVMEYAAGLGVSPDNTFPVPAGTPLADQDMSEGFSAGGLEQVKPGEIGSAAELHELIRTGQVSERTNVNQSKSFYWSRGGGNSFGRDSQSAGNLSKSILGKATGQKRGSIVSKVRGLGQQVQQASQAQQALGQQWFAEGGGFNPALQFGGVAGGIMPQAPQLNPAGPMGGMPGGVPGGVPGAGPGGAGVLPGGVMPRGPIGGLCVLAVNPAGGNPTVIQVGPGGGGVPPGWTVVAGPSADLCRLLPPPPGLPVGVMPGVLGGMPPGGLPPVGSGPAASLPPDQTRPGVPCLPVPCLPGESPVDECTFDIRKEKVKGGSGQTKPSMGISEGADDAVARESSKSDWTAYSSIEGLGTYVQSPGQGPRNTYDCKVAAGLSRSCVEKIASEVSGTPVDDGKSKSADQYTSTLGQQVSLELCQEFKANTLESGSILGKTFTQIVGMADDKKKPTWGVKEPGRLDLVGKTFQHFAGAINDILDTVFGLPVRLASNDVCQDIRLYPIYVMKGIYGFASRWLGFTPNAPMARLDQAENLLCTPFLPSAENAIEGKLTNQITDGEYKCWTEASGIPKEIWDKVLAARKSRLSADQLTTLYRRGDINYTQWESRVRELGWLDQNHLEEIEVLTRQYPGMQDIVRFMVRDVDDPKIVGTFGLSEQFGEKYQERLKRWGVQQGIPEEVALAYWQAHWTIPSPTQLYEMYHRLRHDPKYGGPDAFREIVKTALQQQDILPYWIDKLLEVSFNPLTRVDVRRAYGIGVLNDADVLKGYLDAGYSDENAQTLLEFARKDRKRGWKNHPIVKQAAAGQLDQSAARAAANDAGLPPEFQDFLDDQVPKLVESNRRKVCIAAIRKRYLRGELNEQQRNQELQKVGIDDQVAMSIATSWECEKSSRSKTIAAGQLCKLYGQRLITIVQFQDSLHNLGYSAADALKLLGSCVQGLESADRKAVAANAKAQLALQDKLRKLAEKEARDRDRQAAAAAKRLEALHKARERRSDAIVAEAEALAKKTGESMVFTLQACKGLVNRLRAERGFSEDDAIAQLQLAVSAAASGQRADLWELSILDPLPLHDTV